MTILHSRPTPVQYDVVRPSDYVGRSWKSASSGAAPKAQKATAVTTIAGRAAQREAAAGAAEGAAAASSSAPQSASSAAPAAEVTTKDAPAEDAVSAAQFWSSLRQHLEKSFDAGKAAAVVAAFRAQYAGLMASLPADELEVMVKQVAAARKAAG